MSHDKFPKSPDPARRAESIDACRSSSQDWLDEEIAQHVGSPGEDETLARSLELDEEIHAAYQDVPIPAGLEARLLEKLAPVQKNNVWKRRALLTLAATALVLVVAYCFRPATTSSTIDAEELINKVTTLPQSDWTRATPAQVCSAKLRPNLVARRWATIKIDGVSVTVFEFSIGGVTGYVASYPTASQTKNFPNTPTIGTRGYRFAESYSKGMTHVLIVKGGDAEYRLFVRPSRVT